jgi:transcription termination factor Rho
MSTTQKKRPFPKQKKPFFRKNKPPGGPRPSFNTEIAFIDYSALPADLDEEQVAELMAGLPKPKRKTKAKDVLLSELLAMNMADLLELADKEKIDLPARNRGDVLRAVVDHRLRSLTPVLVEGLLDIVPEGHAFLRFASNDYMPSLQDVYVPPSLVNGFGLQEGLSLRGHLRPLREGEKLFSLADIEQIDGRDPEELSSRVRFKDLVPIYPDQRILLEGSPDNPLEMRIVDLITPIGRGQRGLIVAPPRTGKTVLLQMLARCIVSNAPDAHLIILLVDERPEEVTDFERSVPGGRREVISTTFDEPAWRHIRVAEMVIKKARSMVEAGEHVVILLDSITRLARACNVEAPSNGKLLSGGIEATALQFPKRFFGAARNIEGGGSLTILGTALVETGSKMDEVIFEEFKGTGNSELHLDRKLMDKRIYPCIDVAASGTRREELLLDRKELELVYRLRKVLADMNVVEAMELLKSRLGKVKTNAEFLMTMAMG